MSVKGSLFDNEASIDIDKDIDRSTRKVAFARGIYRYDDGEMLG